MQKATTRRKMLKKIKKDKENNINKNRWTESNLTIC